jgi:diguanylate cyclase (GGDEF)-like protein/PAS domain S-box-containing protein
MIDPSFSYGLKNEDRRPADDFGRFICLDAVDQAVIIKDGASHFLYMNAYAIKLFNSSSGLRGNRDHDFFPRDVADRLRREDLEVFSSGEARSSEEVIAFTGGLPRVFKTKKQVVEIPEISSEKLLLVVMSDMTELRNAENILLASEEHYRSFVELHPQIPWTADANGAVQEIGPGWRQASGTPPQRGLGSGWEKSVHPDDLEGIRASWLASIRNGHPLDVECRISSNAEGKYRWFRNRAAPRRDFSQKIVQWYGLLEDIHPQKLATDALRESEELFRGIADSVPVMMWLTDQNGKATFHSRLWLELTGMDEIEALGWGWSRAVHPDDLGSVLALFESNTARNEEVRLEYRLRRADGRWAWVIDTGSPQLSPAGELLGYAGSILDITERRTAELSLQQSEASVRSIFDSSPDCICVLGLDGELLLINEAGRLLTGVKPSGKVEGLLWKNSFSDDAMPKLNGALEAVRKGETSRVAADFADAEGRHLCMDVIAAPVLDANNAPDRIVTIWRDVTDAKAALAEADHARKEAENVAAKLSVALEGTMDCVLVTDRSWCITYMNGNAEKFLGLDQKVIGAVLWDLYPDERDGAFAEHYRRSMASNKTVSFEEYLPGMNVWLEVHASPTAEGLSIFFRDTTARRAAEEDRFQTQKQILHMSRHDALTGLPNRMAFLEVMEQHLRAVDENNAVAMLTLNLDDFKAVNDTYGQRAGDVLLRQVAERLRRCVRDEDTVARTSGDEFVIGLPSLRRSDDAEDVAARLVATFSDPFELDGPSVILGISVGVAVAPFDGVSADQISKASDVALYRAKVNGRGTFCRYVEGMDAHLQTRFALKLSLRQALLRGEFEVHYQALVSLLSQRITTCEALIRWRDPKRGMVSPSEFIPLAEETGLIVGIGEWVLGEACRQAASWPIEVSVAVNLSPIQFKSERLVGVIKEALSKTGIQASRLQLEITESVLLGEGEENLRVLQQIRKLGVKIAMDDFGTGYSSLGYLRRFRFDKIKVDRSFVSDLPEGKESLAIIRAVVGIGKSLGIVTTVEGVETEEQLATVIAEGFDEAQGYLLARPVPAVEMRRLISEQA